MDHQGEVVHLQDVRELAQRVCQIDLEEKLWSVLAGRSPRKGVAERLVSPRGFFWSLLLTQETEWDSTLIKEHLGSPGAGRQALWRTAAGK